MAVSLIVKNSPYNANLDISTNSVGCVYSTIGGNTQTNFSYLTVGKSDNNRGITFLNNRASVPSDLHRYSEYVHTTKYVTNTAVESNLENIQICEVGQLITLTLEGPIVADTGSDSFTSVTALPVAYRPAQAMFYHVLAVRNNLNQQAELEVGTDGIIIVTYNSNTTSGTVNGFKNTSVSYIKA